MCVFPIPIPIPPSQYQSQCLVGARQGLHHGATFPASDYVFTARLLPIWSSSFPNVLLRKQGAMILCFHHRKRLQKKKKKTFQLFLCGPWNRDCVSMVFSLLVHYLLRRKLGGSVRPFWIKIQSTEISEVKINHDDFKNVFIKEQQGVYPKNNHCFGL